MHVVKVELYFKPFKQFCCDFAIECRELAEQKAIGRRLRGGRLNRGSNADLGCDHSLVRLFPLAPRTRDQAGWCTVFTASGSGR